MCRYKAQAGAAEQSLGRSAEGDSRPIQKSRRGIGYRREVLGGAAERDGDTARPAGLSRDAGAAGCASRRDTTPTESAAGDPSRDRPGKELQKEPLRAAYIQSRCNFNQLENVMA